MGFEQILIRLKVWEYVNTAVESAPTQMENDEWKEFHNFKGRTNGSVGIFHENWSDSSLGKEGSFFELENACTIGSTSFGEDEELSVFASFFDDFLSVSNCGKSFGLAFFTSTSWNIN